MQGGVVAFVGGWSERSGILHVTIASAFRRSAVNASTDAPPLSAPHHCFCHLLIPTK
jgi:hypothetical protein